MSLNRGLILGAILLSGVTASGAARAGDPTKKECVAANEAGQDLRQGGKLQEARAALAVCMAARCPRPVREDCAQRLSEIEAALPTLVFAEKDGDGHDLSAVRVSVDGKVLAEALDGTAIAIDPGEYLFTFEAEGLPTAAVSVVVREGDKNRRVQVALAPVGSPASEAPPVTPSPAETATPPSSASSDSTQRTVAFGLGIGGVVGVAVGSIFGLLSKSTYDKGIADCPRGVGQCSAEGVTDGQSAHTQATVSTVAFIAGGTLIAAGAVLYLTTPVGKVKVSPAVTARSLGLGIGASF